MTNLILEFSALFILPYLFMEISFFDTNYTFKSVLYELNSRLQYKFRNGTKRLIQ